MKNFLPLFLLFSSTTLVAQDYIPMLEEGNSWSVDVYYDILPPCDPSPCTYIVSSQITLGGIETIGGLDYTRIISNGSNTCLLREDNGLVYKYDEDEQVDRVLFDFTLEVNDVFPVDGSAYDPSSGFYCVNQVYGFTGEDLTVVAVEFLELAGEMRKVITFDYEYANFQWIEGIGNISGFDFMWEQIDITGGSLLVCFETSGTNYFFNNATSCDNTTLGLADLNKNEAVLYPNPVVSTSILQFSSEGMVDGVKIFDVTGRLVHEAQVTEDYIRIDGMHYPSGLYFYQTTSEGKIIHSEKFVVR